MTDLVASEEAKRIAETALDNPTGYVFPLARAYLSLLDERERLREALVTAEGWRDRYGRELKECQIAAAAGEEEGAGG